MNTTQKKALRTGGILLALWLLFRKAGSSAPILGDTYGAPGSEPAEPWVGKSGIALRVTWNNPSGDLYGYMSANDIKSNIKDFNDGAPLNKQVNRGQQIGYVQYYDRNTFAPNIGIVKVLLDGGTALRFYPYDFTKGAIKNMVTVKPA